MYVQRGTGYGFCNTTVDASSSLQGTALGILCESGPVAYDQEDGDITHRVLACPPTSCLARGCRGHELHTKGLAGCGVDTENAPVGAVFDITFTVFDMNRPAASASLFRLVTVISPCAQTQLYCPDSAVKCADAPCDLRDVMEESEETFSPPELVVDLSGVPADSAQLLSGDGTRTLSIWGLCGNSLPVDFTHICSESGVAQKPSGVLWTSTHCQAVTDSNSNVCAVSIQQEGSSGAVPTVAIIREESACDEDSVSGCDTVHCSLAAIAGGRCSPSRQVFTLHVLDESSSASATSELQELRVEVSVLNTIASATAAISANVSADSLQHAALMSALEGQAVGSEKCSVTAAALHQFLAQHVQTSGACSSLNSEAVDASSFNTNGHIALAVEVTEARYVQAGLSSDAATESQRNHTLELNVSFTIGADIGSMNSTAGASSAVHVAAIACLDAFHGIVLLLESPGNERGSYPGAELPLDVQTGAQPLLLMTSVEVESIASQVADCPQVAAQHVSIDEMSAAIEDAEMQHHMNEITALVCSIITGTRRLP